MKINLAGNEEFDGGPGSPPLEDFIHVDARPLSGVTVVADIRNGLPQEWIGQVSEIRASHVVEHMHHAEAQAAVKYWAGFLKEGGLLRLYCPNGEKLAEYFYKGWISVETFSYYVMGMQDYELNIHREVYSQERLNSLVLGAGLQIVGELPRPNAYEFDLGVQSIK